MFPKRLSLSFCGDTSSSGVEDSSGKKGKTALNMFLNDSGSSETNPSATAEQFRRPTDISTPLPKPKMSFR